MDNSLKQLESQLQDLAPRGLSDEGRTKCETLIDKLASEAPDTAVVPINLSPVGLSWKSTAAAAAIMLGVGLGSGWHLGKETPSALPQVVTTPTGNDFLASAFELVNQQSWSEQEEAPEVLVNADGEVKELLREADVVEEVVKHRESGYLVTHRFTEHHLIEKPKEKF